MSGIEFIADTNTLLYIINKYPCVQPFLDMRTGISVITEMELLSFSKITTADDIVLRNLISKCAVISLNKPIKERTILLRRKYGTKLPDSIVAATAIECELPLVTADKGFKKIEELDLRLLEL
ncbi:MAG: type II toxin-antitoxin system VapC family toxin [Salinivirgaceae bacterium]|nr:type II toxin-antitoxin system VapC family toxin [Salinivirgaceae bacterium]